MEGTGTQPLSYWNRASTRTTRRADQAGLSAGLSGLPRSRTPQLSATERARQDQAALTLQRTQASRERFGVQESVSAVPVASSSRQRIEPLQNEPPVNEETLAEPISTITPVPITPVIRTTPIVNQPVNPTPANPPPINTVPVNPTQPTMATHVASFKIPVPWDRSSPKFDGKTASSLKRFLRNVKTINDQGGIVDDKDKKEKTLEYLENDDILEQWMRLDAYKTGTFAKWLEEIEELFPELEDAKVGSLNKMNKLCADNQDVSVSDLGAVRRFSIAFANEAEKLLQPPASLGNGQLVDMYLDCLEETFASNINAIIMQAKFFGGPLTAAPSGAIGQGLAQGAVGTQASTLVNRRGDKIPLGNVITIAKDMAEYWAGHTSQRKTTAVNMLRESATVASIKLKLDDETKNKQDLVDSINTLAAVVKDSFVLQEKKMDTLIQATMSQTPVAEAPNQGQRNQGGGSNNRNDRGQGQGNQGNYNNYNNNNRNGPPREGCWYCGLPDHLIAICFYKREHIEMGYIGFENGGMRLSNGQYIPRQPEGKARKERVDDYWSAQGKKRGTQLPLENNLVNSMDDRVDGLYDLREDELMALKVQVQMARASNSSQTGLNQVNYVQPPLAQNHVMAPIAQAMAPMAQMPMMPSNPQFVQIPVASSGAWDMGQLCNLVDTYRVNQQATEQFVATRTGQKSDESGGQGF